MKAHVSVITLGVADLERAKQFYRDLGWPIAQDYDKWVSFSLDDGASALGLIPRDMLAADAGVAASGDGFGGMTMSYLVRRDDRVADVVAEAEKAGATIVQPAEKSQWGGCSGYFADPDGYLWKVASGSGDQPFAE